MALAHNGNLVNAPDLRRQLEMNGAIFHTTNDSEVISYIITRERLLSPSIEEAVAKAMYTLKGAYSLIVMSPKKLIAARDPNGFRPLCVGKTAVSYTHLRAHETRHDIVCRLLLEKKKKHHQKPICLLYTFPRPRDR